ncbi:MAG: RbsD/FucU family protein [Dysgonamonadaceae bacterium]|jgi:L-fucose mutarotase|nr:RbsD/FucU family protein [Dysgonamonadaceae bacterium]
MLFTTCIHPQLLGVLGTLGHGSWILISDGGYPHATHPLRDVPKVYLNLAPDVLTISQILKVLKETVPIEEASVMTPPDGSRQPVHDDFRRIIPGTEFNYIQQFDFYETAKSDNVGLVIASGDSRNFANLLLKVGFVRHPEGEGKY